MTGTLPHARARAGVYAPHMKTIGTWTTKSALSNPRDTAQALAAAGANEASIMLNDFAWARSEREFETHDVEKIATFAGELHAAGLDVTLTTWVMPHEGFIRGMGAQLPALVELTGARATVLDAEEPWAQATGAMSHDDAAELVGEVLEGQVLILSGISYANTSALIGLSRVCPIWSPQAYATTKDGSMDPAKAVSGSLSRWRSKFGEPYSWIMGLACYSQPTPASLYMDPCLAQTREAGIESVCYWSHKPILDRADVREVLLAAREPGGGGLSPTIEAAMVAQLQGLLAGASVSMGDAVHPGEVDGIAGPNTSRGLDAFSAALGL